MKIYLLDGAAGLRRFVRAPWEILDVKAYPQWIPALRVSVHSNLDPGHNPFFRNAQRALFVAEDNGRVLGRIAAIHNGWLKDAGQDPGIFGFFECVDRQDVASGLFRAAEAWLKERGCQKALGPWNPSSNYDGGILVGGFEHAQTFFTSWNPEYYGGLIEGAGYAKAKDLLGWHLDIERALRGITERYGHLVKGMEERSNLQVGPIDLKNFEETMRRCWHVYTECWKANWGFCPISMEEWLYLGKEMRPLMVPGGGVQVMSGGEIIGFVLAMPDFNRAIQKDRSGKLLPLNWLRLLRGRVRAPWVRTLLAGVLPGHRRKGVLSLMLYAAIRSAPKYGVRHLEASWILEDNKEMTAVLEALEADPYRRWRIYQRSL